MAAKLPSDDTAPSHGISQVLLEGSLVNLDVTSPAATLALTLMFLKTNDASVAGMLSLPDTTFTLDFVRPSFILLRILARCGDPYPDIAGTFCQPYARRTSAGVLSC